MVRRRRIDCPGSIRSEMLFDWIGRSVSRQEREDGQGASEWANPLWRSWRLCVRNFRDRTAGTAKLRMIRMVRIRTEDRWDRL